MQYQLQQKPHAPYHGHMTILTKDTGKYDFTLRDRMRKAMDYAGLSIGQVATRLDVNRNTVSNWLNGNTTPKRRDIAAFALATNFDKQWLQTGNAPTDDGEGDSATVVRPKGFEPPAF